MSEAREIQELADREYKYGFVTDIEADSLPRGLDEGIIQQLSAKKQLSPTWSSFQLNPCAELPADDR